MNRAKCRYLPVGTVLAPSDSAADIANPDGGPGPCAALNEPICVGAPTRRAIDFCGPSEEVPDIDLDGNARGLDAPQVPPFLPGATNDLGAYEWTDDVIFSDGFDID